MARKERKFPAEKQKLTPKQMVAVNYYMQGRSKKDSMIAAGYSESTAMKTPHIVFDRKDVQEEIEYRRERMRKREVNMQKRVKDELAKIAFFNMGSIVEIDEDGALHINFEYANMDDLAAIGSVEVEEVKLPKGNGTVKKVKVKPWDKKGALDSLARILGMFKDNVKVEGEVSLVERLQAGRKRLREEDEEDGEDN